MKNLLLFVIFGIFSFGTTKSQAPKLKFTGKGFPSNSDGIYLPQGSFNGKTYWVGPDPDNKYVIYFNKNYNAWELGDWSNDTSNLWGYTSFYSTDEVPIGEGSMVNLLH